MKQVNKEKEAFVLQYILNARLSGRVAVAGRDDRAQLVEAAGDLYDLTVAMCTTENRRSNMNVRVGVAVLIVRNGGVVLVGKRKGSHGEGTWTVPGGNLEMGESVEDCARREVLEETGLELTKVKTKFEVTQDVFSEDKHYITLWVQAEVAEDAVAQNLEPHKCEGWEWHDIYQIPQPHFLGLTNWMAEYTNIGKGVYS